MQSTGQPDLVDQFKEFVVAWGVQQQADVNKLMNECGCSKSGMVAAQYTAVTGAVKTELQSVSVWCCGAGSNRQDSLQEPANLARYRFEIFEQQVATEAPALGLVSWTKLKGRDLPVQHSVPQKLPKTEDIKLEGCDLLGQHNVSPKLPKTEEIKPEGCDLPRQHNVSLLAGQLPVECSGDCPQVSNRKVKDQRHIVCSH